MHIYCNKKSAPLCFKHETVGGTHHDTHQTKGEDDDANHGDGPVHVVLDRPAVDEQAGGDGDAGRNGEGGRESDLGTMLLALVELGLDQLVGERAEDADADRHANRRRNEDKTAFTLAESVVAREDQAEGGKEEVQDAVCRGLAKPDE